MSASHGITALLAQWADGNRLALDDLTARVYAELWQLAAAYLRRERPGHSLQPTALVHEAYLRLLDRDAPPDCRNRSHFFAIAARLMRQILVDHARRRQTGKRAGCRVSLDEAINVPGDRGVDLLALDDSLNALEQLDLRKCRAVELRYFGGLSVNEIAEILNLSAKTVSRDLALAEAWLYHNMRGGKQT